MEIFLIELSLVTVTFCLALYELLAIYRARRMKLTKNLSRLCSHAVIVVFIMGGVIQSLYWHDRFFDYGAINLPLLFTAALAAIISGIEAIEVYKARRMGLTKNISRIITNSLMFFMMASLISLNFAVKG